MNYMVKARWELLEAVARFAIASRPWTPPPPSPQPWDDDGASPTFDVPFRSLARSRSPSPVPTVYSVMSVRTSATVDSPSVRTPPVNEVKTDSSSSAQSPISNGVRRRRGFYEAYPSPLTRLKPIVSHTVLRTGIPNPKYERVGDVLVLRR